MQETSRLDRALGWLVGAANAVSAAFVLLLMILVVADITGRYLFNSPVPMAYEFGSFMLVFIVFLALASTQRAGAHIRVEFVTLRLPPRARTCLDGPGLLHRHSGVRHHSVARPSAGPGPRGRWATT